MSNISDKKNENNNIIMDIRDLKIYGDLEAKVDADLEFIYNDNGKCIGKITKHVAKWKNVKTNKTSEGKENLALISGRENNIIVVDIDKPKNGEFDGIEIFEERIGKIDDLNTIITETPSGGFHIVFKYTPKLKNSTKLTYLGKKYSIDIRSEGGIVFEGKNYNVKKYIENLDDLPELPDTFIDLFKVDTEIQKYEKKYSCNSLYSNDGIKEILKNLDEKYYENYNEWLFVLICLKNMDCDISLAKEFSMNSAKFNEIHFLNQWNILQKRDKPTIGTLLFFLQDSVPEDTYKEIIKTLRKYKNRKDKSGELTDFEACDEFKHRYGHLIKTTINDVVYICNPKNNIWYETKKNSILVRNLIKDFAKYLKENGMIYHLDKSGVRKILLNDLMVELQEDKIEFNTDPYLFAFENGIRDLRTGTFSKAQPEDMIFITTGYDYKPTDGGQMAFDYLKTKFPDPDELRCVINAYSMSLLGENQNEYFYSLTGESGSNGKTSDMELLNSVTGNYGYRFPTNIITAPRENAESGNPAMAKFKGKRFAYCSEPDASRKININNLKELTGDTISCRGLYSNDQEEFRSGTSIYVCSQSNLDLERVDGGIKRRIITIPYDITFVDNPTKPNERKRIDFTKEQKELLKFSMLDLLTSNLMDLYNNNNNFKFDIPPRFSNYKNEYLDDIDELTNFIRQHFEYIQGQKLKSSQVSNIIKSSFKKTQLQEIKNKMKNILGSEFSKQSDNNYFLNIQIKKFEVEYIEDNL